MGKTKKKIERIYVDETLLREELKERINSLKKCIDGCLSSSDYFTLAEINGGLAALEDILGFVEAGYCYGKKEKG